MVEQTQPRVFLLENVDGLAYAGKSEGLELLLRQIEMINRRTGSRYAPTYAVLSGQNNPIRNCP